MAGTGEAWIGPPNSKIAGIGKPTDEQIRTYSLHRVTGFLAFPWAVLWMPPGVSAVKVLTTKVLPALAIGAAVLAIPGVAPAIAKYGAAGAKKLIPYAKTQAKDIASSAISNTFSALPIAGGNEAVETSPQVTETAPVALSAPSTPNTNNYLLYGGGAVVLILVIVMVMRK